MKNKILLLLILSLALSFGAEARAYEIQTLSGTPSNGDFVLGPSKIELDISPGEGMGRNIMITNRLGRTMDFKIEVEDFSGSYDFDNPVVWFGSEDGPYPLRNYITPEIEEFTLEQGQRIVIPVEINIPEDSEAGGLYASVLVSNVPSENEIEKNKGGAIAVSRLGTLFFVKVEGNINEYGFLKDFKTADGRNVYEKGPVSFAAVFQNEGNVHLSPYGKIEIKNILGKRVGEIEVENFITMPNSARERILEWDGGFLLGKYTASLTLDKNYQSGSEINTEEYRSVSFWVIPWKTIAPVMIVIVVILYMIKYILKKFKFEVKKK
ncbi:MAG: hypothetical protein PHI66_04770 [Candidatus Pacebacteria bacterium]|nr:hypothetical protein [Candidatus Paceibacterota bacterium]